MSEVQCPSLSCSESKLVVDRRDMQKVLAEVTDHMEQQHTAHRYLEKLRTENEGIVLKEKERLVRKVVHGVVRY